MSSPIYTAPVPQSNVDMADVLRKKKLAEMLLQMGAQGPQGGGMVGRTVAPISPLAALAPLVQTGAGLYADKQADKQAGDIGTRQQQLLGQWLQNQPQSDELQPVMPTGGFKDPANQQGYNQAQQATTDELNRRKLGWALQGQQLGGMGEAIGGKVAADALKTPESYSLAPGAVRYDGNNNPIASAAPKPEVQQRPMAILGKDGKPVFVNPKDALGATPYDKPAVNVNLPETKYPNAFQTKLGENDAAAIEDYRKSAESSTSLIKTLGKLRDLNPTAMAGGGANARASVANWISGLTGVNVTDPKVLSDTQQYQGVISKTILDALGGKLGQGVSNADVQFISNTVPKLEYSQEARSQLMDYLEQRAKENVQLYQRARSYGEDHNGLKGFDAIGGAFPATPMPAGASDINALVDQYRTKK
jgi:hypothetical protein